RECQTLIIQPRECQTPIIQPHESKTPVAQPRERQTLIIQPLERWALQRRNAECDRLKGLCPKPLPDQEDPHFIPDPAPETRRRRIILFSFGVTMTRVATGNDRIVPL
ncbi:hypothetical protein NPIL_524451, partial [Nephila pilipes]